MQKKSGGGPVGGQNGGVRRYWKLLKNALKKLGERGPVGGGGGEVGQGGVERRIEVVMEMPKKKVGGGGQGGCERRIEVIVTMHKKREKSRGGGGFGGQGGCV